MWAPFPPGSDGSAASRVHMGLEGVGPAQKLRGF